MDGFAGKSGSVNVRPYCFRFNIEQGSLIDNPAWSRILGSVGPKRDAATDMHGKREQLRDC
jgi:hypothetical protein